MTSDGFSCILGFKNIQGEGPQTLYKKAGKTSISSVNQTSIGFHKNLGSSLAIKFYCNRIIIRRLEGK